MRITTAKSISPSKLSFWTTAHVSIGIGRIEVSRSPISTVIHAPRPTPMTSTKSKKKIGSKKKSKPELTEEEKQEHLQSANQIREQRAENELELAKLFLENEKPDIALRRLKEIVAEYSGSAAATEAKSLMKKL